MFRALRADEVECRIGMVKDSGVQLLLYKDARCDMNVLDETVGAMNWKKEYRRDNANCVVSIWDSAKSQWISKEDTGTESQTEAEKGLASDSFKRACVNWGIGRELYTAPFIFIGGATKKDRFRVKDMTVENRVITALTICRENSDSVVYSFPAGGTRAAKPAAKPAAEKAQEKTPEERAKAAYPDRETMVIKILGRYRQQDLDKFCKDRGVNGVRDLSDVAIMGLYSPLVKAEKEGK